MESAVHSCNVNKRDYQNGLPGFRVEKGIVMIYEWHFFFFECEMVCCCCCFLVNCGFVSSHEP